MADDDRQRAIDAVLASSRKRPSSPRWLWIAALLVSVGCAVAFIVAMVRGGDAGSGGTSAAPVSGSGFPAGLALGVGIGIAIGWFAARRQSADESHSSRKSPKSTTS